MSIMELVITERVTNEGATIFHFDMRCDDMRCDMACAGHLAIVSATGGADTTSATMAAITEGSLGSCQSRAFTLGRPMGSNHILTN